MYYNLTEENIKAILRCDLGAETAKSMEDHLKQNADARREQAIEKARKKYCNDEINIDDSDMILSVGEDGIWVSSWLHVDNEELEEIA